MSQEPGPRWHEKPALVWAWWATRFVLGAIFLWAGIVKAGASEGFAVALAPFTILPEPWLAPFAIGLAWTEIIAGIQILLPRVHIVGAGIIFLLSIVFIGVLTWALSQGIIVSCGCFGGDAPPSASAMLAAIIRDVAIAAAAAGVILFKMRRCSGQAIPHQDPRA